MVRESLRLLKTLAGNDNVKSEINSAGGIAVIINSIMKNMVRVHMFYMQRVLKSSFVLFQSSKPICFYGCSALTAICLRNSNNAADVVKSGGAQLLTQIMKTHIENPKIIVSFHKCKMNHTCLILYVILQTSCCNAIRNVVSRSPQLSADFVGLDVENLLQSARAKHPKHCDDAARAALRDLGLKVDLKEEWKGEGGLVSKDEA